MKRRLVARHVLAPAALVAAMALAGCAGGEPAGTTPAAAAPTAAATGTEPGEATASGPAATNAAAGRYLDHAAFEADPAAARDTTVVLFFHAPWCPDCRATETSLTEEGVPDGLTVVKVDYDSATDLKRTYGVTQQHTFVSVDADGTQLRKWAGSRSGADILAQATG